MPQSLSYRDALAADPALVREGEQLVLRARHAEASQRAALLQRAGELFRKAGADASALSTLGLLIDSLLECDRVDAAIAQCRRTIRLYPDVVRAHCTLGFLLAARGDLAEASLEMDRYAAAARRSGVQDVAVRRLRLLAQHPVAAGIHAAVRRALLDLGDGEPETPLQIAPGVSLAALLRAEPDHLASFLAEPVRLPREEVPPELPWLDVSLPSGIS